MSKSAFSLTLVLSLLLLLGSGAGARAELVTFMLDPARSSLMSEAILVIDDETRLPLTAQDPNGDSLTTSFTGSVELDVDDLFNPTFLRFESAHMLGEPSGEWLPAVGGGSEGDPGPPADAQFGYKLDMGATATGYFALRDTAFTLTSDLLFVSDGMFDQLITMTATQGSYDYNLSSAALGDAAGTDDVTGEAGDNSGAPRGTYAVDGELATLTLPIQATFGEGDEIEVTFTGSLVATVFFGDGVEGDYNDNGLVEQQDLDLVLANWGDPAAAAPASWLNDLPEGNVDQTELDKVLANWGDQAGGSLAAAAAVPEPSALILLLLAPTPLIARLRW